MKHNILTLGLAALVLSTGALAQTSTNSTGSASTATSGSAGTATTGGKATTKGGMAMMNMAPVNVNTASLSDLQKIPGMNAKLAQAVVAARPIKNQADLVKRVKGIGKKNVKKFAQYLKYS